MWKTVKNQEEGFLPLINICFRFRDMSFQSHGSLEEKREKKIENFVSL